MSPPFWFTPLSKGADAAQTRGGISLQPQYRLGNNVVLDLA